jgi:peptidoglycan/LPS O-acetylase OafA/YrhL
MAAGGRSGNGQLLASSRWPAPAAIWNCNRCRVSDLWRHGCAREQALKTRSQKTKVTSEQNASPPVTFSDGMSQRVRRFFLGFRRITSSTVYLPEIDGLRFVAIACVFIFHLAGDILRHSPSDYRLSLQGDALFSLTQRLNFGVQLFFVVSGFVLALPFASQHLRGGPIVNLRRYFLRRVTRLEPPYVAALIFFFVSKVVASRGSIAALTPHLLASVGYVHNLVYSTPSDINFVAWSLEVEVQFYLLAPLLAYLLFLPRNPWARRSVTIAAIVAAAILPTLLPFDSRIGLSLLGQLSYFLAGILLADVYAMGTFGKQAIWGDWLAIGAVIAILPLLVRNDGALLALFGPLMAFAACYAVFKSVFVCRVISIAPIASIGGMCYSIYLVHNYVIAAAGFVTERAAKHASFETRLLLQSVLLAPLVLLVSAVFYKLIEQPCMKPDWPLRAWRFLRNDLPKDCISVTNAGDQAKAPAA